MVTQRIRTESEYNLTASNSDLLLVCQAVVYLLVQAIFLCILLLTVSIAWSRHVLKAFEGQSVINYDAQPQCDLHFWLITC